MFKKQVSVLLLVSLFLFQSLFSATFSFYFNTQQRSENVKIDSSKITVKQDGYRSYQLFNASSQINGAFLTIENPYIRLQLQGSFIRSMKVDGNGAGNFGVEWVYDQRHSGYWWFNTDGSYMVADNFGQWNNLTEGSNCDAKFVITYTFSQKINATFMITLNGSQVWFNHSFSGIPDLTPVQKNGWLWIFNQTTEGYEPELIDMMWGYINGQGRHAMTMHQNKRRPFHYIWTTMEEYFYQGTPIAGASIKFTPPAEEREHLFLNESNHLGVATWHWNKHVGNQAWNLTKNTPINKIFKMEILPTKTWKENGPKDYPVFEIDSNKAFNGYNYGDALTRFFWERTYTYLVGIDGNWIDWFSSQFAWNTPYYNRELINNIDIIPISEIGHPASWGNLDGWPFPDNDSDMYNTNWYDTRHPTTMPNFITAIWRTWQWSTNDTWLNYMKPKIYKVAEFMNSMIIKAEDTENPERIRFEWAPNAIPLPKETEGLMLVDWRGHHGDCGGLGSNYWDIEPFGWLDGFVNPLVYMAFLSMADFELYWGNLSGYQFYIQRAEKLKQAYNKVFWDDLKGRFIGCIDAWGKRHDYGFTFINQQAGFAGIEWNRPLVEPYRIYRMYNWMENEPTATGFKDTFSRYKYAAIANTEINSRYYINRTSDRDWWSGEGQYGREAYEKIRPWPWCGTGNGQLQNGGCSTYTSFHDIMTRIYGITANDAEERLSEILERWSLPDHMCGGPKLYLGEIPQQEDSGTVGTDYPFPESGLVPTVLIFGFLGIQPKWMQAQPDIGLPAGHVIDIKPAIPDSWNSIQVKNMLIEGQMVNMTLNKTHIMIEFSNPPNTNQQIMINGTRTRISDIIDANNKIIIEVNSTALENERYYWNAMNEYQRKLELNETLNEKGSPALIAPPSVNSPNFRDLIRDWWNQTVLLIDQGNFSLLIKQISEYRNYLNSISYMKITLPLIYEFVEIQIKEADDSLERGDLRWCLANLMHAKAIAQRTDIISDALQIFFIPILICVNVIIWLKKKKIRNQGGLKHE